MHDSHFLLTLAQRLVLLFVVTNMLALGMGLTIKEVTAPLRNVALSVKAFLANFVLVPIVAYLLVRSVHLEHGYALGLILLATAAGDPFVTKASQIAKGDPAYTVALMVALQVVTIFYMPVVLPLLLPGVKVEPLEIAKPLIVLMLIPLAIGFFVRARYESIAHRLSGLLDKFSSVVIAVALSMFVVLYFDQILRFGGKMVSLTRFEPKSGNIEHVHSTPGICACERRVTGQYRKLDGTESSPRSGRSDVTCIENDLVPLGEREEGSRGLRNVVDGQQRPGARPVWARTGYTVSVNRRFVAFLIMLAIGLQGPSLAYAAALSAKTMPAGCAGHTLGQNNHDKGSCCPQGSAPGLCCAVGIVFTGMPSSLVVPLMIPGYRMPAASGFVAFATERPTPLLRPPIA